jgi:hypothetical protein
VIELSELTVKLAGLVPKSSAVTSLKFAPVIVTSVPPAYEAPVELTLETVGAGP